MCLELIFEGISTVLCSCAEQEARSVPECGEEARGEESRDQLDGVATPGLLDVFSYTRQTVVWQRIK